MSFQRSMLEVKVHPRMKSAPRRRYRRRQRRESAGLITREPPYQTTVLHPVGTFIANNDLLIAVDPTMSGVSTYYTADSSVPSPTNGFTPPPYQDGWAFAQPLPVTTVPDLVIKAVNVGPGGSSSIVTAEFLFQVANPIIIGNNAAQFTVSDITSNVCLVYH